MQVKARRGMRAAGCCRHLGTGGALSIQKACASLERQYSVVASVKVASRCIHCKVSVLGWRRRPAQGRACPKVRLPVPVSHPPSHKRYTNTLHIFNGNGFQQTD